MRSILSVEEAASELGISGARVRQLVAAGRISAVKVGGRWVVERAAVEVFDTVRDPSGGRPFTAAHAWGILLLASRRVPSWLEPRMRRALRVRLHDEGLVGLVPRLRSRAEVRGFRGAAAALARLARRPGVVATGHSVATRGAPAEALEAYVSHVRVAHLVRRSGLARDDDGNVKLRVVRSVWPFEPDDRTVPAIIAAVDLLESPDATLRGQAIARLARFDSRVR